jgi:phosphatidylinositol alpha 1,6-mannosyltransferase
MRVAYFTESLYPLVDGVSRTLARLFDSLEEEGIDFRIFSPFVPPREIAWSPRVHPVRYVHFPPYPDYRVSVPRSGGARAALERFRPDLIHVASPTPMGYWAQRQAHRLGIPVVASFHTHFVSYFRYYRMGALEPLGWWLLRRFYRGCARVYAPTWSIVGELEERGIRGVELWSRGVDLQGFSPARRDSALRERLGVDESRPLLLLVSRLVREKDLAELVEADRELRGRGVRYRLALVGDGPMRGELEEALPQAYFAGHSGGEELAAWYASADVFVFPSTTETLGNVVLEALASGVPAVVSDEGGPQDLIADGETGYVFPAHDVATLAERLGVLLSDPALRRRLGEAARASAIGRDWTAINADLVRSYERVISVYGVHAGAPAG